MTALTKAQRRGVAAAFGACKKYLWDGRSSGCLTPYICWALADSEHRYALVAQDVIEKRLMGHPTVSSWLRSVGVPPEDLTGKRLQAHRHAWVNKLIEEFSQ